MTGADPLPAEVTDEVFVMPSDDRDRADRGVSNAVLAERLDRLRIDVDAHETADAGRHVALLAAIGESQDAGAARGVALTERMDVAASRRETRMFVLVGALVLAVLGLAGVQVSGGGFGGEGTVGGVAAAATP